MSSSLELEIKPFRWLLSHSLAIFLFASIVYIFLNYGDQILKSGVNTSDEEHRFKNKKVSTEVTVIQKTPEDKSLKSKPTVAFSERLAHYQQSLSPEEQEKMRLASEKFRQKLSEKKQPYVNADLNSAPSVSRAFTDTVITTALITDKANESDKIDGSLLEKVHSDNGIAKQINARTYPNNRRIQSRITLLQREIPDKSNDLQQRMLQLIPLDKTKIADNRIKSKKEIENKPKEILITIKPLIQTPEQATLLAQARSAAKAQNFSLAEKKYQQLMLQLPDLPDVVGELAMLYKQQKKQSDYLSSSTLFVKRLVNHNRFSEAWEVVEQTAQIDNKIAKKQRDFIIKKQVIIKDE